MDLKFKIWDTIKKEMYQFVDIGWIEINTPIFAYNREEISIGCEPNIIFLPYTGRKDKNGIEVYKGDILKDYDLPVEFFYGSFGVRICYDLTFIPLHDLEDTDMEVIGNEFENPELLCDI